VTSTGLQDLIEQLAAAGADAPRDEARNAFTTLRKALSDGSIRAAEPDPSAPSGWKVNAWVKRGILLGFRFGETIDMSADHGRLPFFDKDTLPLKPLAVTSGVRVVPGGSSVRDGAYFGRGVICMPPMYVNIGAYVGDETLVGGNCGVYEGAIVKRRAVLASGTILTRSTPLYDLPNGRIIEPEEGQPLVVPEGAVVVPGSRQINTGRAREWGLSVATPIIVKYRDDKTSARTALEEWIR
jgi:2,3,4,5-tetrahydropyridine-2-carboxylate N-succinyltransferase